MEAPDSKLVLGRLGTLTEKIAQALPKAAYLANRQFDLGDEFEPVLFDTYVRWQLKSVLKLAKIEAEYEREDLFDTIPQSNCGIELFYNGLRVKINKGTTFPKPRTTRQEQFYSQQTDPLQPPLLRWPLLDGQAGHIGNVVFLWHYDVATPTKVNLFIACPAGGKSVREVWRSPIAVAEFSPPIIEADDMTATDLPIFADDDAGTGTPYFALDDQATELPGIEELEADIPDEETGTKNDAS